MNPRQRMKAGLVGLMLLAGVAVLGASVAYDDLDLTLFGVFLIDFGLIFTAWLRDEMRAARSAERLPGTIPSHEALLRRSDALPVVAVGVAALAFAVCILIFASLHTPKSTSVLITAVVVTFTIIAFAGSIRWWRGQNPR